MGMRRLFGRRCKVAGGGCGRIRACSLPPVLPIVLCEVGVDRDVQYKRTDQGVIPAAQAKLGMVPKAGLEPARLAPHAPQTCVSAIPPLRRLKMAL